MTPAEAQAALAAVALELTSLEERLARLVVSLPDSPDREEMWEHRIPYGVATELVGTIECVLVDSLRPAIEQLEAASRVTAADLHRRFGDHA